MQAQADAPPLTDLPSLQPVSKRDDRIIITIDGPAGTGKSSVAGMLARRLNVDFLDTGAMYRAAALLALERNIDIPKDGDPSPEAVAALLAAVREADIRFDWTARPPTLLVSGVDRSRDIRDDRVTKLVSQVAALGPIREWMVERQRDIASEHPRLVTEGRDQGSKVFVNATLKFYLVADAPIRAARRAVQDVRDKKRPANVTQILKDIMDRDRRDSERKIDPLRRPEGSEEIDTSHLDRDEVIALLHKKVRAHLSRKS